MDILKGLHKEFGWFIWGLVGLGFLWFFTGGPQREVSHQGAYLKPPAPLDTGEAYGKYYAGKSTSEKETLDLPESPAVVLKQAESKIEGFFEQSEEAKKIHETSLLSKSFSFDGVAGAKNTKVDEEYIRIVASEYANNSALISNLMLKGRSYGIAVLVPKATNLPLMGVSSTKTDVSLPPGGRAIISTGRSPIGTSFRVNACSGYLDQFQNYTPALFKECPLPKEELALSGIKESSCEMFAEKLPRCRLYSGAYPSEISTSCKNFIAEKLNYNSCALRHKDDAGFYKNEWRLFLDKKSELWAEKSEIIRLLDSRGNTIDAITY
jgi:hypothetical protein